LSALIPDDVMSYGQVFAWASNSITLDDGNEFTTADITFAIQ